MRGVDIDRRRRHSKALDQHLERNGMTTTTIVRCRYLRLNDTRCTGEAVDGGADVLLCTKHLGRALRLINERRQ